jgi:hypothetical protein
MRIVPDFYCIDFSDIKLPQIVVYKNPHDYPNHYVARIWEAAIPAPTDTIMIGESIEKIREGIPEARFHRLDRHPNDDPGIFEVWI